MNNNSINNKPQEMFSINKDGLFPIIRFLTILYASSLLAPELPPSVINFFKNNKAVKITTLIFTSWVFGNDITTSVVVVLFLFFIVEGLRSFQRMIEISQLSVLKKIPQQLQKEKESSQEISQEN